MGLNETACVFSHRGKGENVSECLASTDVQNATKETHFSFRTFTIQSGVPWLGGGERSGEWLWGKPNLRICPAGSQAPPAHYVPNSPPPSPILRHLSRLLRELANIDSTGRLASIYRKQARVCGQKEKPQILAVMSLSGKWKRCCQHCIRRFKLKNCATEENKKPGAVCPCKVCESLRSYSKTNERYFYLEGS